MAEDADLPLVSVIMPVRDEAEHLAASLGSVLAQDWPAERLEVIVVDGASTDGTPARARALAESSGREVVVLDNPSRIVPVAMNLGLEHAGGSVVVRVDGHCTVPPNHVRRCVQLLEETGADCAGGVLDTRGETTMARAIAAAQSHPLGVGPVAFRTGGAPDAGGPVDTLAFGAYRSDVFDRIGRFDEELVRNQDDELNLRLTRAGGTIWLDPSLVATYTSRADLRSLWRQYEGYGSWKVRVAQKHRGVASWRHLVPAAFVAGLAGAGALAAVGRTRPLAAATGLYAAAVVAASARADHPVAVRVRMPVAFACLHLAYGVGSWRGAWRWREGWRRPPSPVGPPRAQGRASSTPVVDQGQGTAAGAQADAGARAEEARVTAVYRGFEHTGRATRWARSNPGNRRTLAERDAVLLAALDEHPLGRRGVRVLDVGCGTGAVLASLRDAGVPAGNLRGLDVRAEAVAEARTTHPDLDVQRTPVDRLTADDASADVVLAFTLFSSVRDPAVARRLADEVQRVLAPGGLLVWYDLRVPSPGNRSVRPQPSAAVRRLFPDLVGELRPITLLPPLARRLGPATDVWYPRLAVGPLRTHLVGVLHQRA